MPSSFELIITSTTLRFAHPVGSEKVKENVWLTPLPEEGVAAIAWGGWKR